MTETLKKVLLCVAVLVGTQVWASGDALSSLLQKGPVVLVEEDEGGGFAQATAIIDIDAAPEEVWSALLAMQEFKHYMPKIVRSDVMRRTGTSFDVRFVYDIPGPDTDYTARMSVNEAQREIVGRWLRDDLKGSLWTWRLRPHPGGRTLLFHTVRVQNFSPLLKQVDDEQQTVTVGVNVSSALATVKALKRRVEAGRARAQRTSASNPARVQ